MNIARVATGVVAAGLIAGAGVFVHARVGERSVSAEASPILVSEGQWGCDDTASMQKANACRADCRKANDEALKACDNAYRACAKACKSGDGFKDCRNACRETSSACRNPVRDAFDTCKVNCVKNTPGCRYGSG